MDEELENTNGNQIIENNQRQTTVIDKDLPYMSITDMFDTPEYDEYIDTVDLAKIQNLNAYKSDIDRYGISAMANMAVSRPTLAANTFDPVLQQNPPVIGETPDAMSQLFHQPIPSPKVKEGIQMRTSVMSNIRQTDFNRFYNHPKYAELGFSPYANNEEYYNDNSTVWDDMSRMKGQLTGLIGTGFMSGYRTVASVIGGESFSPDLVSATEMEDAMAIGNSSREGTLAWTNNFLLNSAYTIGIISSIAVEEVAMIAGTAAINASTAATLGGTAPAAIAANAGFIARTVANAARVGRAISNTFSITKGLKYSYNMVQQMRNLDRAKLMYHAANSGQKFVGKMFFPETTAAIRSIKSAENAAQNISNMAKTANTFGGFYKDMRSLNYTLAESKLESGMVYNTRIDENIQTQVIANNGGNVTSEQMLLIQENASKAGFSTLLMNAPMIFISNQLLLSNAFGGFSKSFKRMANNNVRGLSKNIIRTTKAVDVDGKLSKAIFNSTTGKLEKGVFEDAGTGIKGLLKRTKSLGVKGNAKAFAGANLSYFAANFAEGIQELGQEAITHGTNHYYDSLFKDPLAGGVELEKASINSAVHSQMSMDGVSTFMSGFLMGGLVSGPQKLFFQGIPATYNALKGKGVFGAEGAKIINEQKARKKALVESVLNHMNLVSNKNNKLDFIFDEVKFNFLVQKQVAGQMTKSAYDGDQFGFTDAKDFGTFHQIHTVLSSGNVQAFEDQFRDFINMSDEALLEAWPAKKESIKNGKLRGEFENMISQIRKTEDTYNQDKDENPNPHDPSQFKRGTRAYQKEITKQLAFEHIRYLKMFTKDGFNRSIERYESIKNVLSNEPLFDKMAASDLTVLLDTDSIKKELQLLDEEIKMLKIDGTTNKKIISEKEGKRNRLSAFADIVTDPKNLTKDGVFNRRKINTLKSAFKDYAKFLANSNDSFVDESAINDVLIKMVDYTALKGRAKLYYKTIELLNNPKRMDEILDRQYAINDKYFDNTEKDYKKTIEKYLETNEKNALLNQIDNLSEFNIVPDVDEVKKFLEDGNADYLQTFRTKELGIIDFSNQPELRMLIENTKAIYIASQDKDAIDVDGKTDVTIDEDVKADVTNLLHEQDISEDLAPSVSEKYNQLLTKVYSKYQLKQVASNKEPLTFEDWNNSKTIKDASNFKLAFNNIRSIWIANAEILNTPLSETEILDDNKFISWLLSPSGEGNDLVDNVLSLLDIDITDITGVEINTNTTEDTSQDTAEDSVNEGSYSLLTEASNDGFLYTIIDNKTGKPADISNHSNDHNSFINIDEATSVMKEMEEVYSDIGTFSYDGAPFTLKYSDIVYDSNNKKYIVLSKKSEIESGKDLRLIPADKIGLNNEERIDQNVIETIPIGAFNGSYTKQNIQASLEKLGPNVSRLNVSEPITPYPFQNYSEKETYEQAHERFNAIFSSLSKDEINELEFVISHDQAGGISKKNYQYSDRNIKKEPNPYIVEVQSKYKVGIRVSPTTQSRINKLLKDKGIPESKDPNNIFAFINIDGFSFNAGKDKPIIPVNFTKEQMENIFRTPDHLKGILLPSELLANAQKNFAANEVLAGQLDIIMEDHKNDGPKIISISELPEAISFISAPGGMKFTKSARPLDDLDHSTVNSEGNHIIYKLYNFNNKPTVNAITDLDGDAGIALLKKVKEAIKKQNSYNTLISRTDVYKAVVLMPDGSYRFVALKGKILIKEELDKIYTGFFDSAEKTIKNEDKIFGEAVILNKNNKPTNRNTWNIVEQAEETKELRIENIKNNSDFYISTIRGYNIEIQVSPWGQFEMQVFDNTTKNSPKIGTVRLSVKDIQKEGNAEGALKRLIDKFNYSKISIDSGISSLYEIGDIIDGKKLKEGDKEIGTVKTGITSNNFRKRFAKFADVKEMISRTETNVSKEIAYKNTISLSVGSADRKGAEDVEISTASVPKAKVETNDTTANKEELAEIKAKREFELALMEESEKDSINAKYDAQIAALETNDLIAEGIPDAPVITTVSNSPLAIVLADIDASKAKLQKGKKGKDKRRALTESKEHQALLEKRDSLTGTANKILAAMTTEDVEDIKSFTIWANNNLPQSISIQDIALLGNNLKAGGIRVGAFVLDLNAIAGGETINGTLYTGAKSPYRYHEAFHGVFRMLLSDTEIKKYLSIARKEVRAKLRSEGKSFKQELERFRNSADTYTNMSESRLEQEYYEEYLADEFEKFKTDPKSTSTSSEVKSLFTRILDWIKSVFGSYNSKELQTLFENIDAGKYLNASAIANQFTTQVGVTLEANALIPYARIIETTTSEETNDDITRDGFLYLDSIVANPMIGSMAANYLQRVSNNTDTDILRVDMLEDVIDDFYALYDPERPKYKNASESQIKLLNEATLAIDDFPEIIKKQVYTYLNIIDSQSAEEEYNEEFFEDTVGLRGLDQWKTDATMIGGVNSTPKAIRAYIASTTVAESDFFGNKELTKGEKLIVPVNFNEVYSGLLKSVKNIEDPLSMLQGMYIFGMQNTETAAVINRLMEDIGISKETLLNNSPIPLELKDPFLFQSFTKAFENFRTGYLFNQRDPINGDILWYSAAERDDINSQVDVWSQAWGQASKKLKSSTVLREKIIDTLDDLYKKLDEVDKEISTTVLRNKSIKFSKDIFELTGINLSPQFIAFSLIKNKKNLPVGYQTMLLNANKEESPISSDAIFYIRTLISQEEDIFAIDEFGANSRIKTLAIQNAPFDERIGTSVFKNAEGNLVYAHQKPTFHLKRVNKLNDSSYLESLKEDTYLENNYLLNSEAFKEMSNKNRQKILRIAGSSIGKFNETESDINDNISGVSSRTDYGNFTPQEFALSIINSYTALVNTISGKVQYVEHYNNALKRNVQTAIAPVMIRVMEASNIGDMIPLPIINAVKFLKGNAGESVLTDEVLSIFTTSIETEFNRIRKEVKERAERKLTGIEEGSILGFNINIEDRAYKLNNSSKLLDPTIKKQLEDIANRNDTSFKDALIERELTPAKFNKNLIEKLNTQYEEFSKEIEDLNIAKEISTSIKYGIDNGGNFSKSGILLNLSNDTDYNLKQIFFSNWINTKSINEVLLGDQAITLKNSVDAIKRAKANNAAFISAYSAIAAPKAGVMHPNETVLANVFEEPEGISYLTNKNIDKADAQLYYTLKGLRYSEFGFGSLTPMQAKLIDRLQNDGQRFADKDSKKVYKERTEVTEEEIFGPNGFVTNGSMLNSRKLVYFDGPTFIKMSAFILIPQLTSNNIETDPYKPPIWVAKENKVPLHNLRVKLERQETEGNAISIAAPLSAFKMLKQNIGFLSEFENDREFIQAPTVLSAKDLGLQVANPSNKMESIDPSQIKAIVTSEQTDDVEVPSLKNSKGKVMTVGQIRTAYNLATNRRVLIKFKNKENLVFTYDNAMTEIGASQEAGKITPKLLTFLKFAQGGLKASQSSSNLLEFFSDKNGEQQYDLNNQITVNKFEQLFLSYLSKGTLVEKIPGHTLALASSFGVSVYRKVYSVEVTEHGVTIPYRSEITREKVWERLGNKPEIKKLSELTNENIPAEGVYILDRLRSGVMKFDSKGEELGERHTEMLMPAHFAEIIRYIERTNQPMPEAIAKMFAIRIPSQDNHSTINIEWVDFLPAVYGSVAMFADELVEISGADFDIDKIYAQIKEWYIKDKKFHEYGSATTDDGKYEDYINYVNLKVNKKGSPYNEALLLKSAKIEDSLNKNELEKAIKNGFSKKAWRALQNMGLPITKNDYLIHKKKHGEPYEAPFNNQILDYKYALMGNDGVTKSIDGNPAISYTPAGITILETIWDEFKDDTENSKTRSNYMVERSREDNIDVDSPLGMIKAWKANKGASIGAIVSPNINLSLLTEYKINIKPDGPLIEINGVKYNTFKHLRERLTETVKGERKQDIISALITMATDNAKERLVAKLGLNRDALALVGNLTALSVPIITSILLINNPAIQTIYNEALNKKEKMDPGVDSLLKTKINNLNEKLSTETVTEELIYPDITDELLRRSLDNEITDLEQLSILLTFKNAMEVKNFTSNMRSISDLTNGLGKNMAAVNTKKENIDKLFDKKAIMDLSKIYKSDTWQSTYLSIFNHIYNNLLPATFLSATPQFAKIMDSVLQNIDIGKQQFTQEVQSKISRDLLSYITIKAYQHNGGNGTSGSIANLNNNFIYPSDENSIINVIEKLKNTEVGQNNFFLQEFAISISATNENNYTGINVVESNSYRSLDAQQKIDLQTSFAKIYGTPQTKDDALSIINYIMVKDGLQLAKGTLLDAISPFIMTSFLDHIATANAALRNGSDQKMTDAFGLTFEEMENDFIKGYFMSNVNNALLSQYSRYNGRFNTNPKRGNVTKGVVTKDDTLTVDYTINTDKKNNFFIRIKDSTSEGYVKYTSYIRDDMGIDTIVGESKTTNKIGVYNKYETFGSNQQWGGGFMFGPRPTYLAGRLAIPGLHMEGKVDRIDGVLNNYENFNFDNIEPQHETILRESQNTDVIIGTALEGGSKVLINDENIAEVVDVNNPSIIEDYDVSIASTLYELNSKISEEKIKSIYDNYKALMNIGREGKAIPYRSFKLLLKKYQVYKYKDTYIFGQYDTNKGVFITRMNSSPTSKELLSEAIPNIVSKGIDVISFVPKDYADKLVRSGYTSSTASFEYDFKGESMQKFAVGSNANIFQKIFNKSENEITAEEIENYADSVELSYTPVEVNEDLIKQAGNDASAIFETYLNQFGIVVDDVTNIKESLGIDELGIADLLSRIAHVKDKKDLPPIAGEFIAHMMQYNPLVKDIAKSLSEADGALEIYRNAVYYVASGLGKSVLAKKNPNKFADIDDIIQEAVYEVLGENVDTKKASILLFGNKDVKALVISKIKKVKQTKVILSSISASKIKGLGFFYKKYYVPSSKRVDNIIDGIASRDTNPYKISKKLYTDLYITERTSGARNVIEIENYISDEFPNLNDLEQSIAEFLEPMDFNSSNNYQKIDKSKYFKIIGGLIAKDLQNKLEGNYSKTLVDKIKELIKRFLNILKNVPLDKININIGIISNNILQQNKKLITASLYKPGAFGKETNLVTMEGALAKDSFGKSIIYKLSDKGFILTGSTALAEQGDILRPNENPLHDIDWVSPFSREETERRFRSVYPDAIRVRDIQGEDYVTDSFIIAPKGYSIKNYISIDYSGKIVIASYDLVDAKGKIAGSYKLQNKKGNTPKKEIVTGVEAKVIDFFSYEDYSKSNSHKSLPFTTKDGNVIQLSNWKNVFKAKLAFARYKDIWDYNRYIPNAAALDQSTESSEIKEEDLSFKKGKLETFTLADNKEAKGTRIIIKGHPNTDLFTYKDKDGWEVIDNKSKNKFNLSAFFYGSTSTKNEILEALHGDIVKYSKEERSRKVLENIGFNFKEFVDKDNIKQTGTSISYTPKGKAKQAYTVDGVKIFNKDGMEVFKEDSKDRNKIFANLAVSNKTARVVSYKGSKYVVNNKDMIMSVSTGNIMNWDAKNGNRIGILKERDLLINPISDVALEESDYTENGFMMNALDLEADILKESGMDVLDFEQDNPVLLEYWEDIIEQNPKKMASFVKNNMGTYKLMIKFYNKELSKGMYPATKDMTSEEVFIEEIKCIL